MTISMSLKPTRSIEQVRTAREVTQRNCVSKKQKAKAK